ncbi:MAG: CotH kinase family protein [Flavobacteriales bacterium]|nr:CotH kinase family protein [Flavobacteriales bacterium]
MHHKQSYILFLFLLFSFSIWGQEAVELSFSPIGGIYEGGVSVKLQSADGARIYYTTDGSSPSSGAKMYRGPIEVKDVSVIRAVAYLNGRRSQVQTQSYFCDRSYSLPIVSLATHPDNLFDFDRGIYVKGCCADTVEPYLGANFWKDWEYRANIEMYLPNGDSCFNQEVGINIFGGFSRWLPQKSIAIFARSKYGKSRIEYPIFPERDIKKYKSFVIRNSGGDFKRTHFRDAFMTQLAKPTGVAIQAYRPVVVYINGQYWGIQNLREKISEHYLKSNYGVDKENVDILRHNGVARHGTSKNYKKLLAFLRNRDMTQDETVEELRVFMDVEDYIRYNIAEVYSDNRDAGGNIRYWRERTDSSKWRWVLYDLDLGLGNNTPKGYKRNTLQKFTSVNNEAWPDPPWSTFIIRKLLENKKVEQQYINTFADQLNTVYHPDTAVTLLNKMQDVVKEEMKFHVKRWGTSYKNWEHHVQIMRHFASVRPYWIRKHIMTKFELQDTSYVSIVYPGKDVAAMQFNSLKINRDFKGVYFDGVPVTATVKPKHDYDFVGWKGRSEKEMSITFNLEEDVVLEPMFEPKKRSVFTDSIIFNELMICQTESDTSQDWVELYNNSSKSIDLSGWGFTQKSYQKRFTIAEGVKLEAGAYLILSENLADYSVKYNIDTVQVIGDFSFGLSRESEHLKLYDKDGFIVDSLTYHFSVEESIDSAFSYSLVHPDSSRAIQSNWIKESPGPGNKSKAYAQYLIDEENKRYWTRIYYIGGGSFFFTLVAGLLFFRYYKRKKKR